MSRGVWLERVGPPSILLGSALLLTGFLPAASSAGLSRPETAECPPGAAAAGRAALRTTDVAASARVDQRLSRRGELTGRALQVERADAAPLAVELPTESFVGQPHGGAVVYTRHTPALGSEVRVLDVESGCDTLVARPEGIVRSALLDRAAAALYVHAVGPIDRQDLGITRHDLESGAVALVVPPLPPSDEHGPTFATELRWSTDSAELAVQSCGFARCRTRVLDTASGDLATYDDGQQGALVGLSAEHLVTFASCPGHPCAVVVTDLRSGDQRTLADVAYAASIISGSDGPALSIQTSVGNTEVAL